MQWLKAHSDVLLIVLSALTLRVSLIDWVHERGYTSDEKEYIYLAEKLSQGEEFVDSNGNYSVRAPLFPHALALSFEAFGATLILPHIIGALLGTLIVWLGFRLSMQILNDKLAALVTAGILALYPGLILYADMLQTETMYIVLVLIAFFAYFTLVDEKSIAAACVLGLTSGLACLTRTVFVGFFPIMLASLLWVKRKEMTRSLMHAAVAVVACCAVLAPWTLRNHEIHSEWIPVSSWGGNSLLTGNNPYATGTWSLREGFDEWFAGQASLMGVSDVASLSETARSSLSSKLAKQFIQDEPGATALLAAKKAYIMTVFPISNSDSYIPLQLAGVSADALLYGLICLGIVATWKSKSRMSVLYAAALFFILIQVILHAEARYRLPVMPLLTIFAGVGGAVLLNPERRHEFFAVSRHKWLAASVGIAVFIVYAVTAVLHINNII